MHYFEEENNKVRQAFNLEELLIFQLAHDVQIIRGEDYQYVCWINKVAYLAALTPMFALVFGIAQYNTLKKKK